MKRKFYNTLIKWKENNMEKPLMVVGARQIGKTYIIEEFCKNEFKDYIYVNLLKDKSIKNIFEEEIDFEMKIKKFELEINKKITEKTIIFFDEIQESEQLICDLKAFCESEKKYNIVCAGSLLGVKIKRFHSSFPVGKVKIEYMYPMDFEEFLVALGKEMWVEEIKRCFKNLEEISIHEKLLELYRIYLCIGGMPEAIKNYIEEKEEILLFDKSIAPNLIMQYLADMNKYTKNKSEAIKTEMVYNTIPTILAKENKKFKYTDVKKYESKREVEGALEWLIASNLAYKCSLVNKIEPPIKAFVKEDYFKLYLSDVGLLTSKLEINFSDIMLDKPFMLKGAIAENYVAQVFRTNGISLYYWKSNNMAEIDFLLYNDDGIIPVEVKANDNTKSKSLNVYIEKYKPKYSIRLSTKNFGYNNKIKSIPLYAAFLIK